MGWYDQDAAQIFRLPLKQEAERLLDFMGGKDKVIVHARQAIGKKEYAWAAQLVAYAYLLNPDDKEVRRIKGEAPHNSLERTCQVYDGKERLCR
jgi:alkyl sulfatase BDS1-like metallo-beta-lactamase superfamily hydrolase